MNEQMIMELKQLLEKPRNIVIVPHRNPDGDAVGASLALYHFLEKLNHNVTVVSPNDYPEFLKWIPGSSKVLKYDMQNRQSKRAIDNSDIIFLMDFNALHRVGNDMENKLQSYEGTYIMIDHHQEPDDVATYIYSDTSISSTCQMVYHFIENLDLLDLMDDTIATAIYTGIMTDTGSFRFPSTTSTTHRIVADLIDLGAQNFVIHNNVYDTNSFDRLQLLGRALGNLKILPAYKTAYITLTQEELNQFNFQKGDTEGVVNYALSLKDVIFAAIFIEDVEQKIIKISFRSKGSFSVNQFSRKHFNGGGHDNAAGGRTEISLKETATRFEEILSGYKKELKNSYEV